MLVDRSQRCFAAILLLCWCSWPMFVTSAVLRSGEVMPYHDPELMRLIEGQSSAITRSIRSLSPQAASSILNNANDTELVRQSGMDEPWQQFIVSGPMTVNLLGQLMVVSSKLDFSFVDFFPDSKFVYMKYPSSFRATLTQIANDGWRAFLAAHSNMNKIQMYMQLIPGHVKTSLKILAGTSSTQIIANLLPKTLAEIRIIGANCVTLSNSTHQTFLTVMELLGEVISTTEVARGLQETRLRQVEIDLNVSRVMQGELGQMGETIKSHYNEARGSVQAAQTQYSKALKSIPTGFKALLIDFGRAVVGIIGTIGNKIASGSGGGGQGGSIPASMANTQSLAYVRLFSDGLGKFASRATEFLDSSNSSNPIEEFEAFKVTFEAFRGGITAGVSSDLKSRVLDVIQQGLELVDELSRLAKRTMGSGTPIDPKVSDRLKNQIDSLMKSVKPLVAAGALSESSGVPSSSSSGSVPSDSSGNERFVAQMASERLRDAEKRYDAIFGQLKQQQEEMSKLMVKIASLDMARINYREILELLREALHLLSQVREQWSQLVLFFSEIAARAEIALSGTLGPFIEQATQAGSATLSREERLFYVDLLITQAVEIHKQSYSLFIMSRTYVDMSGEFIMKRLAGLSKMLTARSDSERKQLLMELNNETEGIQSKVVALVQERKATYTASIAKRQKELTTFVAALGGPQADNQKAIDEGKELLGLI